MVKTDEVPKRTRTPDKYPYIIVNKKSFIELMSQTKAVLEEHLGFAHSVEIQVSGFSGDFLDEKTFTETLTDKEWEALQRITVYMYASNKRQDGYPHSLRMNFGGWLNDAGLEISYGDRVSDIQKIAIKQSLDSVIVSYSRNIVVPVRLVGGVFSAVILAILIWIYMSAPRDNVQQILPFIFPMTAFMVWMGYLIPVVIHNWLIPRFETSNNIDNSKLRRSLKVLGYFVGILSFIGTILSIVQFLHLGGIK